LAVKIPYRSILKGNSEWRFATVQHWIHSLARISTSMQTNKQTDKNKYSFTSRHNSNKCIECEKQQSYKYTEEKYY